MARGGGAWRGGGGGRGNSFDHGRGGRRGGGFRSNGSGTRGGIKASGDKGARGKFAPKEHARPKRIDREEDVEDVQGDEDELIEEDQTPFKQLVGALLSEKAATSQRKYGGRRQAEEEFDDEIDDEDEEELDEEDDEDEELREEDEDEGGEVGEESDDDEEDASNATEEVESDDEEAAGEGSADEAAAIEEEEDGESSADDDSAANNDADEEDDEVPNTDDVFLRRLTWSPDQMEKVDVTLQLPETCVSEIEETHSRTLTVKGNLAKDASSKATKADWTSFLKPRVLDAWRRYRDNDKDQRGVDLSPLQAVLADFVMKNVVDVSFVARSLLNAVELRELYCLHIVNHLIRMRDRVEKHDAKIALRNKEARSTGKPAEFSAEEEAAFRDQGFCRPRVLVILPYKSSAFRFVKLMMELFPEKTRFRNLERFVAEFGPTIDEEEEEENDSHDREWKEYQQESKYSASWKETDFALGRHPALEAQSHDDEEEEGDDVKGKQMSKRQKRQKAKKKKLIRPVDWHNCFEENAEEDFRVGIAINSKRSVKLYSDFYLSDLIIASPLGLRLATKQAIGAGQAEDEEEEDDIVAAAEGGMDDEKDLADDRKRRRKPMKADSQQQEDTDFLSSVEIVVIDEADVFHTQNWQHLEDICVALNRRPKVLRKEMDFSRVYESFLDSKPKLFRQTLVFSAFPDAQLNALLSRGGPEKQGLLLNASGSIKIRPKEYVGASSFGPAGLVQRFRRLDVEVDRFEYFTQRILQRLCLSDSGGILLFVPSYLEFLRVRKAFKEAEIKLTKEGKLDKGSEEGQRKRKKKKGVSDLFEQLHEYSAPERISRARTRFFNAKVKILIMTERFYYYYRYRIRGVHRAVFYGPPQHASFYSDILDFVGSGEERESVLFFNALDAVEMERIVGSRKCKMALKDDEQGKKRTISRAGEMTRLAGGASEFTIVCEQTDDEEDDEG